MWRLVILASALTGFGLAVSRLHDPLTALSQQASLLTGVVYAVLLVHGLVTGREPRAWWWRGTLVIMLMLVCVTFITILQGTLGRLDSLLEHLITPLLVLADFLVVGRVVTKWWYPITWLGLPLVYLVYYVAADLTLYGKFLNPGRSSFPLVITGFMAALLALGYLLHGYGTLRRVTPRTSDPAQ
ncbi:hypothetical protein [Actinocrispum sp. NPDC049592]|uniref:hypothetical protein n=1 Tax=Actinocrispum sp. NPDC049592 TaxID=3154835 RepID=UPI0034371CA6